jgi:hypothetical protein
MKRALWAIVIGSLLCVASLATAAPQTRDGSHDFDFDVGRWHLHSWRLEHPLTGSTEWIEMEGTTVNRSFWGGRGNIAEVKVTGAKGTIELIALRRYDVKAHQWYLDFATPTGGSLGTPSVGEFRNGRGDFFSHEAIGGRSILIRFSIWPVTADIAESEQAFSDDGGRTWELNWRSRYTRIPD